jgi:hypothetical protein
MISIKILKQKLKQAREWAQEAYLVELAIIAFVVGVLTALTN